MNDAPDFELPFARRLAAPSERRSGETRGFNDKEEFFLRLPEPLSLPSFPIHHQVQETQPSRDYQHAFETWWDQVRPWVADLLEDSLWAFDPRDPLHPGFYQVRPGRQRNYLVAVHFDVNYRPHGCRILVPGTNDRTPSFETRDLYLDAEVLPLEGPGSLPGALHFLKVFDQTWKGESGRGYFQQGVWIESGLSRFLSKLVLPAGAYYPYQPLRCRYNSVSSTVTRLDLAGIQDAQARLERVLAWSPKVFEALQSTLQHHDFSEQLPLFQQLREKLGPHWADTWGPLRLEVRLNEENQKEFRFMDGAQP